MKLKTFLILQSLSLAIYGLALMFATTPFLSLYGVALSPGAAVALKFFGGVAAGNAILGWLIRNAAEGVALRAILFVFAFNWLPAVIFGTLGQLAGAMNALGWSTVAIGLFWMVVFGYYWLNLGKPATMRQPAAPSRG